jgi:heme exporter protein D
MPGRLALRPCRPDMPDADLGRHAAFIWAAYAAAALILGGLVLRAIVDYRAQRRALTRLEARAGNACLREGDAGG